MKINIGPYTSDLISVRSWERSYEMWRSGELYLDEDKYTWYDKIVMGFFDKLYKFVRPINNWSNNRKRKIKVHVDDYDVWGADHTLGIIIHPVLVKLKELKHGSPVVDDEDVPENLRANKKDPSDMSEDDSTIHDRWSWVLDEMIWTFSQYGLEDDSKQFHHNSDQLDLTFTKVRDNPEMSTINFNYQKDPSKPKYWRDDEGLKKHAERKANGRRLFAKYYESLWD